MKTLRNLTKILKALSDEGRIRIISLLKTKKNLCVCEIQNVIGLSQPTISVHLRILENAGLVEYKKDGLWVNYNLRTDLDKDLKLLISSIVGILKDDKKIKEDCKKVYSVNRKEICKK